MTYEIEDLKRPFTDQPIGVLMEMGKTLSGRMQVGIESVKNNIVTFTTGRTRPVEEYIIDYYPNTRKIVIILTQYFYSMDGNLDHREYPPFEPIAKRAFERLINEHVGKIISTSHETGR